MVGPAGMMLGYLLAIQDAVTAAHLLSGPLRQGCVTEAVLEPVQKRREFPTRITQAVQVTLHNRFAKIFQNPGSVQVPWQLKTALRIPGVQRAPGHAIGMGARPEHIQDRPRPEGRRRTVLAVTAGVAIGVAVAISGFKRAVTR